MFDSIDVAVTVWYTYPPVEVTIIMLFSLLEFVQNVVPSDTVFRILTIQCQVKILGQLKL